MNIEKEIIGFIPTLRLMALNFVKTEPDIDDLVQESLYKALKYKDKFSEKNNNTKGLKGWLYTIIKNTYINKWRRLKNLEIINIGDPVLEFDDVSREVYTNNGEQSLLCEEIRKRISALPKRQNQIFNMYLKGIKYREIADVMKMPVGTVKTDIHLARKYLQKKIKRY